MKTYRVAGGKEYPTSFEIENIYISVGKIAELLSSDHHVMDIKKRKMFSSSSDVHIKFKFKNMEFIVWEQYGDSSRYWILPEHDGQFIDVTELERTFINHKPSWLANFIGNIFTLEIFKGKGAIKK